MNELLLKFGSDLSNLIVLACAGALGFLLKTKIVHSEENKIKLIDKQWTAFTQLLELHSQRAAREHHTEVWLKNLASATKDVLLWCPDDVLYHYSLYTQAFKSEGSKEQETHFANAIFEFRKTVGYKNWRKRITPDLIVTMFKVGYPDGV